MSKPGTYVAGGPIQQAIRSAILAANRPLYYVELVKALENVIGTGQDAKSILSANLQTAVGNSFIRQLSKDRAKLLGANDAPEKARYAYYVYAKDRKSATRTTSRFTSNVKRASPAVEAAVQKAVGLESITFNLPVDDASRLKVISEFAGIPVQALLRTAVSGFLKEQRLQFGATTAAAGLHELVEKA